MMYYHLFFLSRIPIRSGLTSCCREECEVGTKKDKRKETLTERRGNMGQVWE